MAYGRVEAGAQEGALANVDVYDAAQPDEPVGRVIDAARHAGSVSALFEIALAALPGDLRLGGRRPAHRGRAAALFHSARVNALTSACRTRAERAPAKRAPASESVEGNQWKLQTATPNTAPTPAVTRGQRAQDRDAQGGPGAPPAASAPSAARQAMDAPVTVQINGPVGVTAATARAPRRETGRRRHGRLHRTGAVVQQDAQLIARMRPAHHDASAGWRPAPPGPATARAAHRSRSVRPVPRRNCA